MQGALLTPDSRIFNTLICIYNLLDFKSLKGSKKEPETSIMEQSIPDRAPANEQTTVCVCEMTAPTTTSELAVEVWALFITQHKL